MTQYASFDHTQPSPQLVTGWYDTVLVNYPSLPASDDLLELDPTQWFNRLQGQWAVSDGALVPVALPTPTIAQQAQQALNAGLTVTFSDSSLHGLNGTYPVDQISQGKINSTEVYILKNSAFPPNNATTINVTDMIGGIHTFPNTTVYQEWANAVANYAAALWLLIDGNTGSLPPATVTI